MPVIQRLAESIQFWKQKKKKKKKTHSKRYKQLSHYLNVTTWKHWVHHWFNWLKFNSKIMGWHWAYQKKKIYVNRKCRPMNVEFKVNGFDFRYLRESFDCRLLFRAYTYAMVHSIMICSLFTEICFGKFKCAMHR